MTNDYRAELERIIDAHDADEGMADEGMSVSKWTANLTTAIARARALLDRLEPQPVPVSERLPGPEDCDAEGNVWAWRRFDSEGDMDNGDFWCLAFCEWLEDEDCSFTHWLPVNALPTPEPNAQ